MRVLEVLGPCSGLMGCICVNFHRVVCEMFIYCYVSCTQKLKKKSVLTS